MAAATVLLLSLAAPAAMGQQAQPADTVRPGDLALSESAHAPYRITWDVIKQHPDGRRVLVAVWTDTREIVEVEGRRLVRFETEAMYESGRERHDIVHRDPATGALTSVELQSYNQTQGWAFMGYAPDRVEIVFRRSPLEDARWETAALPGPVFNVGDGAWLLRMRPREVGDAFVYPAHDARTEGVTHVTVQVTGREPPPEAESRWGDLLVLENSAGWKSWMSEDPGLVVRLEVSQSDGTTDIWVLREMEMDGTR